MEETNADGTTVRGTAFQGSMGLYLKRDDKLIEGTTLCREFIEDMGSLLEAVKAAEAQPPMGAVRGKYPEGAQPATFNSAGHPARAGGAPFAVNLETEATGANP